MILVRTNASLVLLALSREKLEVCHRLVQVRRLWVTLGLDEVLGMTFSVEELMNAVGDLVGKLLGQLREPFADASLISFAKPLAHSFARDIELLGGPSIGSCSSSHQ